MRKIICGAILVVTSFTANAQVQLEHWFCAPKQFTVYASNGGASITNYPNVPAPVTAGNRGYNSIYENSTLLFYIANGTVYTVKNGVHNSLVSLDSQIEGVAGNEYGIVPHPQNYVNLCQKKFFIIYSVKKPNVLGKTKVIEVDMLANNGLGSYTFVGDLSVDNDLATCPMAISKLRIGNERFIYLQGKVSGATPSSGLKIFKLTNTGSFQQLSHNGAAIPNTKEMELNNAGNTLAYTGTDGKIKVTLLFNGLPYGISNSSTNVTIQATNAVGLEFDDTGNKLYFTDANGMYVKSQPGVINSSAPVMIQSAISFQMLEKSYSESSSTTQLLCGNGNTLQGRDIVTGSVLWTSVFNGTFMPDQIDGEYANANLLKAGGSLVICLGNHGSFKTEGSPTLISGGFTTQLVHTPSGSIFGTYSYNNTTYSLPTQSSDMPYSVKVFHSSNPSCALTRSWTTHVIKCQIVPLIDLTITPHTTIHYKLSAQPQDEIPVDGTKWYVSELEDETHEPVFTISNPPCWQQLSTTDANTFKGFAPTLESNYSGQITDIPCPNEDGLFLYDRTYKITREAWIGSDPHEFYSVIVRNGQIIEPEGSSEGKPLGIEILDAENPDISIFPNPGNGIFTLTLAEGTEKASVEIYNDLGTLVMSAEQSASTAEMDFSKMPKGIYLIKVVSGVNNTVKKIILE